MQMAAVVCCSFLLAWLPYAAVSLMSALISSDDHEAESPLRATGSPNATRILDVPPLLNWSALEEIYGDPEGKWGEFNDSAPALDRGADPGPRPSSSLPPVVTLIPAMLAKSHCMLNPIIYQMMSREFRVDLYGTVFGQEVLRSRRGGLRRGSSNESKI